MKCLICKTNELQEQYLENGLKVHSCSECKGKWMRFEDYFTWHINNKNQIENIIEENYAPVEDSTTPKICPDCGSVLIAYKISNELGFKLEHCGSCNGIWFDKNEWESIRKCGLHHNIHNFFTEPWQKKIREDETKEFLDKHYAKKFGAENYEKLKQVRKWLDESEDKSMLLAYLMNKDPYKL